MNDYEIIKKKYSERMAKLCRTLFPTILEHEGLLSELLMSKFEPNSTLFEDIALSKTDSFRNYINSFFNIPINPIITDKTPEQLLEMVGYKLYKCETYNDMLKFKKYYLPSEELCSFGDRQKTEDYYVFFAVNKDAEELKREDFTEPFREDLYGTSVVSIQFSKGINNVVSIKNRYNHTVQNPDATFSNNLENIIPGLTYAFEKYYDLNIIKNYDFDMTLENYHKAADGRFYKYNYEIKDIYYCPNNIIIDNEMVIKLDSSRYKLVDYFIVDFQDKTIELYDKTIKDTFEKFNIEKIDIKKIDNTKNLNLIVKDDKDKTISFKVDNLSRMYELQNDADEEFEDCYLFFNNYLKKANFSKLRKMGNRFLSDNSVLEEIKCDNLEKIGDECLTNNSGLTKLDFPNVKDIGMYFLYNNVGLKDISLPKVEKVGDECFFYNEHAINLTFPELVSVGNSFFQNNKAVESLYVPKIKNLGIGFFGDDYETINRITKYMREMKNKEKINETENLNNQRGEDEDYDREFDMSSQTQYEEIENSNKRSL